MIYVTGDTHGNFWKFDKEWLDEIGLDITKDDKVIICGDFGLLWAKNEEFEYGVKFLEQLPFQILWVTGNHENYDWIEEFPLENWMGGKVRHIIRDKVILLERGQVFELEGKKFFTFGGASCHDVEGGILDRDDPEYSEKRVLAHTLGHYYRINHVSWWKQELPTEEEMEEGRRNLALNDRKVDYVITHCGSTDFQERILKHFHIPSGCSTYDSNVLTEYLEEIEEYVDYEKWFCGHYHVNVELDEKHVVLYDEIVALPTNQNER